MMAKAKTNFEIREYWKSLRLKQIEASFEEAAAAATAYEELISHTGSISIILNWIVFPRNERQRKQRLLHPIIPLNVGARYLLILL